jgi:hypothetical protein
MREIKGPEAQTDQPRLNLRQKEIDNAIEGIGEIRKRTVRVSKKELLSARDDGRK